MGEDSSSSKTTEFEFGLIKPTSPISDPKKAVSPADEFFLNGRLLPHSFPIQSRNSTTTRISSSSRDSISLSLMSSRSSSISSSRSSSSDIAERKMFQKRVVNKEKLVPNQGSINVNANANKNGGYGSTFQRWQIINIISHAPVLDPSVSRRRRSSGEFAVKLSPKKKIKESDEEMGICQRILRSFVKSCKACHAMEEGAALDDHDLDSFVELK